jgi:polar amino acid transport system substrate-binding protein
MSVARTMRLARRRAAMFCVAGATLGTLLLTPAVALAMSEPKATVQPNGIYMTNDTVGGAAARLTWEATTDKGESVASVELEFPKGTTLEQSTVDAVILEGLKRVLVESSVSSADSRLTVTFDPSVPPESLLRLQVQDVVFPKDGGVYRITGSYTTSEGPQPLPPSVTFPVKPPSFVERMVRVVAVQGWVASWNNLSAPSMFLKPQWVVAGVPLLFIGWLLSLALVGVAFPLAIFGGLMLAFMRMAKKLPPIRWISGAYVSVIRGTPLFLQIYIAFIGLPLLGIKPPPFATGVIVLALNSSAYLAEIFRAGIQSISRGQFEAASSLGMSYAQSMQFVIIPQTVKRVLPTMTSEFILLFKDTSLLSAVGVFELMMFAKNMAANTGNMTPYVVAAAYYLVITIPLINWVGSLERKLAVSEGGQPASSPRKRRYWWKSEDVGSIANPEASVSETESR